MRVILKETDLALTYQRCDTKRRTLKKEKGSKFTKEVVAVTLRLNRFCFLRLILIRLGTLFHLSQYINNYISLSVILLLRLWHFKAANCCKKDPGNYTKFCCTPNRCQCYIYCQSSQIIPKILLAVDLSYCFNFYRLTLQMLYHSCFSRHTDKSPGSLLVTLASPSNRPRALLQKSC